MTSRRYDDESTHNHYHHHDSDSYLDPGPSSRDLRDRVVCSHLELVRNALPVDPLHVGRAAAVSLSRPHAVQLRLDVRRVRVHRLCRIPSENSRLHCVNNVYATGATANIRAEQRPTVTLVKVSAARATRNPLYCFAAAASAAVAATVNGCNCKHGRIVRGSGNTTIACRSHTLLSWSLPWVGVHIDQFIRRLL